MEEAKRNDEQKETEEDQTHERQSTAVNVIQNKQDKSSESCSLGMASRKIIRESITTAAADKPEDVLVFTRSLHNIDSSLL
ncbi:hypothetical protein LINPERHAP2_LOCUS44486 [Linum perenne]